MLESLFLSISPLILWKEPFSSRHCNQWQVFSNGFWRLFGMGHSGCPCTRSQKLLSSNRINSCPQAMELAALEKGVERPHRMLWCSWASFPARLVRRKWLPMVNPGPIRMLWKGALAFLSNETYRTCLRLGSSTNFWVRTVKLGGMKPHQTKLRHRTNTLQVKSTLGRSYTFGPYQPDQQSLCLNKNNREFVSGTVSINRNSTTVPLPTLVLRVNHLNFQKNMAHYHLAIWSVLKGSIVINGFSQMPHWKTLQKFSWVGMIVGLISRMWAYLLPTKTSLRQRLVNGDGMQAWRLFHSTTNFSSCTIRAAIMLSLESNFI